MTEKNTTSFHSGFAAVVGRPSVGKSTLINSLLRQKIASVSPRPQTTRRKQLGIYTSDTTQLILIDTPGIHQPVHKLGEYMNQLAIDTLQDADVILWLVDGSSAPLHEDKLVAEYLQNQKGLPRVILGINKSDQLAQKKLAERVESYKIMYPVDETIVFSAKTGEGVQTILESLSSRLPEGVRYYDDDQITDLYERDIVIDLIRESVLILLQDEVPHAIGVRLDEYTDEGESFARIHATLMVERESQKAIVIGQGGKMIKQIGILARKEIEALTERKVYLELKVKVLKNWRDDPNALRQLGYYSNKEE